MSAGPRVWAMKTLLSRSFAKTKGEKESASTLTGAAVLRNRRGRPTLERGDPGDVPPALFHLWIVLAPAVLGEGAGGSACGSVVTVTIL